MAEFCECKSLMINGSCTNKKCQGHKRNSAPCSYEQAELILNLCKELGEDPQEHCTENLTSKQAQGIISELLFRKEFGEEDEDDT